MPWGAFAAGGPDLTVTSITNLPTDVLPGDTFAITAIVTNGGTVATPALPTGLSNTTKFYLLPTGGGSKKNLKGMQIIKTPLLKDESDGANVPVTLAVYSDTLPGTYNFQACADGAGVITESDEGNNCTIAVDSTGPTAVPLIITVHEAPDLVITSVSNPPGSAGQGKNIQVKNTVKNVGPVASGPSITKYYLVTKNLDGVTYTIVTDLKGPLSTIPNVPPANVPGLAAGGSFSETEMVTVRPETPTGQYQLQACADGEKLLPERDNDNNCLTSSGKIDVKPMPDLKVTGVTVQGAPLTVHAGDALVISADITNQGGLLAKASTLKLVLVNTATSAERNLKGTLPIPQLLAFASTTVQSTTNVTVYSDTLPGTYTVQVCADSAKIVDESIESNNCLDTTATVTVEGTGPTLADLVVTAVTDPQADAIPGDTISVTPTIENQGTDPVDASTANPLTISFYLVKGNTKKNLKAIPPPDGAGVTIEQPIAASGTVSPPMTVAVYSDTLPGIYTLQACADGPQKFSESNESNNCKNAVGTIEVHAVPNLTVTSIQNPPSQVTLGDSFPIVIQVKNVGTVVAPASRNKYNLVSTSTPPTTTNLKVKVPSDALPPVLTVPILKPNEVFSDTETLSTRAAETALGVYHLQACADGGKDVPEGDENDNCKTSSGTIQVTAQPDYVVTSITVKDAPLQVRRGGTLTVNAIVMNQGVGNALKDSVLKYFLVNVVADPPTLPKNLNVTPPTIAKLGSGKTASVSNKAMTVYGDTPFGTYTVQACADYGNDLPESSETNNCTNTIATVEVIP